MESLLVQILATALTLSQALVAPETLKTQFDPVQDRREVVQLLQGGCAKVRQAFKIENFDLDELIATMMTDRDAVSAKFRGVSFSDMHTLYRMLCERRSGNLPVDLGQVIEFYNKALAELPDHNRLRDLKLPGTATILDGQNARFTEVFEPANRRISVPLAKISEHVQKAFIATEDRRFLEHKGVDERGLIRAFVANLASSGRGVQGGSTITQQVAKNFLVGNEASYTRKMREMVVATRIERILSKPEILELYLNGIFLGRGSWGVEMAARSYFGKSADALTLKEAALLAAVAKGPNAYNPDRRPQRASERTAYVLSRMVADGAISEAERDAALGEASTVVAYASPRRTTGYHFVDYLAREARQVSGLEILTNGSYEVRSTIDPKIQRAAESALQDGLAAYEMTGGRARFAAAETNLSDAFKRIESRRPGNETPAWQQALKAAWLPLYDVHWTPAIVLGRSVDGRRGSSSVNVGLADGRVLPLAVTTAGGARLEPHDVVYVRVTDSGKAGPRAELRVRPQVQGAVVVLENKTGRILAMVGGFSYRLSQLNRAAQSQRQPGSALKPLTYLAALNKGLQPNTLVPDSDLTLAPIGVSPKYAKPEHYWSPSNYDGGSHGSITLRQALEKSRNLATAHVMAKGIDDSAAKGLDTICELAVEARVYRSCVRYYPFVLGAQPVRPIDLAGFYAAIANEGKLPQPYAIESIVQNDNVIYQRAEPQLIPIKGGDAPAFYQLKSILQGVVQRGTAARMAALAPYIGGKTGTTDEWTDAWFVGFSNEVTIAVWVGYDNADGKRRTLGSGRTGSNVAIPIFEPVMQAVWRHRAPRTPLAPPSEEAARELVAASGDAGERHGRRGRFSKVEGGRFSVVEYLRRDANGKPKDMRYAILSKAHVEGMVASRERPPGEDAFAFSGASGFGDGGGWGQRSYGWGGGGWGERSYDRGRGDRDDRGGGERSWDQGEFGRGSRHEQF